MRKEQLLADTVFLVHELLSPDECAAHIAFAEGSGFEEAGLGGGEDAVIYKQVRDNDRVMRDDDDLAKRIWSRIAPLMPADWFGWKPVGLNTRWRYYRYGPGQRFAAHTDGCYTSPKGEESQFTLLIYLNDDYTGGTTNFYETRTKILRVQPEKGLAVLFAHQQLHEGGEVLTGKKYALRTDVMFARSSDAS